MLMNLSSVFYTEQSYSWGSVWQSEQNFNSQDALKKNKNTFGKSHTPLVFLSLDAQIFSWIFRTSLSSEHREAHSSTFCALDEFYANFLHLKSQIVHRFNAASHYTMWDGSKLLDSPTFKWLGWFFFFYKYIWYKPETSYVCYFLTDLYHITCQRLKRCCSLPDCPISHKFMHRVHPNSLYINDVCSCGFILLIPS